MLVQARVRTCTTGGMLVSFLMFFQGAVDQFHLYQVILKNVLIFFCFWYFIFQIWS